MILHYIKIALRNIAKYKTQNFISIVSVAVAVMFFTGVWSGIESAMPKIRLKSDPNYENIYTLSISEFGKTIRIQHLLPSQYMLMDTAHLTCASKVVGSMEMTTKDSYYNIEKDTLLENPKEYVFSQVLCDSDYLQNLCERSAVTGKIIGPIKDDECVVNEELAMRVFGTTDIIGQKIRFKPDFWRVYDREKGLFHLPEHSQKATYTIADVVAHSVYKKYRFSHNFDKVYHTSERQIAYDKFYITLKPGFTQADLEAQAKELIPNMDFSIVHLASYNETSEYGRQINETRTWSYGLAFLILFGAVISYLRMQIQLFGIRKREFALRNALGATTTGITAMLLTEAAISLALASGLCFGLCSLLKDYLKINLVHSLQWNFWPMNDFEWKSSLLLGAVAAVVMIATVSSVVLGKNTRLAESMRSGRHHIGRNIAICTQIAITTLLICLSMGMLDNYRTTKFIRGIKNEEKLENCFVVPPIPVEQSGVEYGRNVTWKEKRIIPQLSESLQKNKNVVRYQPILYAGIILAPKGEEWVNRRTRKYIDVNYSIQQYSNGNIADMLGIEVRMFPNAGQFAGMPTAIVSDSLYAALQNDSLYESDRITMNHSHTSKMFYITGTYHTLPYFYCSSFSAILTHEEGYTFPAENDYEISGHKMMVETTKEHNMLIERDIIDAMPENFKKGYYANDIDEYKIKSYAEKHSLSLDEKKVSYYIAVLLSLISIIGTVAALFSTIQLDTRRRQKEVALRKINGATGVNIAFIFSRTYMWLLGISFMVSLSLCLMFWEKTTNLSSDTAQFVMFFVGSALIVTAVTALTIGFHIRRIMRINPAEIIKTE